MANESRLAWLREEAPVSGMDSERWFRVHFPHGWTENSKWGAIEAYASETAPYRQAPLYGVSATESVGYEYLQTPPPPSTQRCLITGNECGSDTWMAGQPCRCQACQAFLNRRPDFDPWGIEKAMLDEASRPTEMALCEINALILHPDQCYVFRAHPGCEKCAAYLAAQGVEK